MHRVRRTVCTGSDQMHGACEFHLTTLPSHGVPAWHSICRIGDPTKRLGRHRAACARSIRRNHPHHQVAAHAWAGVIGMPTVIAETPGARHRPDRSVPACDRGR